MKDTNLPKNLSSQNEMKIDELPPKKTRGTKKKIPQIATQRTSDTCKVPPHEMDNATVVGQSCPSKTIDLPSAQISNKKSPFSIPLKKIFLFISIIAVIALLICLARFLHVITSPAEIPGRDFEVVIPSKTTFSKFADDLASKGVIRSANVFRFYAKWHGIDNKIRIGRFMVRTDWTPDKILKHLAYGKYHMTRVTLPEGLPIWEVGRRLEAAGFVKMSDFEAVCSEKTFLKFYRIPFSTAEGFLYPETYMMMRPIYLNKTSARNVLGVLVSTFWKSTEPLWGKNPKQELVKKTIIMASIVEKETAVPSERSRVAGVYANRIKMGMLLQADPTVSYGIGKKFVPPIRRSHLDDENNPYNTYKHNGMPPGPICSPGKACIIAALKPENHSYLYFVAKADGTKEHTFSKTVEEHNKAVKIYRERKRK